MEPFIHYKQFSDIDLNDSFFESLKADYPGFEDWFNRKCEEKAYVIYKQDARLDSFLYIKKESGPISDITPELGATQVMKIGTMKINPHGSRLGERFIKKALDLAINEKVEGLYVTVFPKHETLVGMFKKYGFIEHGYKESSAGKELALWKSLKDRKNDLLLDYPRLSQRDKKKYMLSIFPEFHTRLFPDSILKTERFDVIEDVSHTNSIHKNYISFANVGCLQPGDIIVIYRTSDIPGRAYYRSVATSICVVEEVKSKRDFTDLNDFLEYCHRFSVFSIDELRSYYLERKRLYVIKMTYNIALRKRLTRERLIKEVGIEDGRWTFIELTDNQFENILVAGDSHESLVID